MKGGISKKYALWFSAVSLIILVSVLLTTAIVLSRSSTVLRESLRQGTTENFEGFHLLEMTNLADFMRRELFNPLYELDIERIDRTLKDLRKGTPVISIRIADDSGMVLTDGTDENPSYGTRLQIDPKQFESTPVLIDQVKAGYRVVFQIGVQEYIAGYGEMIYSNAPLKRAIVRQDEAVLKIWQEFKDDFSKIAIIGILSIAVVAILISVIFSKKLSRPLVRLRDATRRLAKGDLGYRVEIGTGDELGDLAASLNQMGGDLQRRTTDLAMANESLQAEIEERKQTERALRESEERLAMAQRAGRVGVFDWDLTTGRAIWTQQLEELFGLPPGGFEGNYELWEKQIHSDDLPRLEAQLKKWINERRTQVDYQYRFIRTDGENRWMEAIAQLYYLADGTPARMIGTNIDITDRKMMEEEMMHLAHHDILTGLPNRLLFANIMEVEIAQAHRNRQKLALLFLDLDRFKEVNDTFGHEAGDELLKEVSKRLKTGIRESDTASRIGGDEFNVILADINRVEDVTFIARKILELLRKPFYIAGHELQVTTSVGISVYPDDSDERETLYRYADIAMYHAKMLGKNRFQFYNPAINVRSIEKIRLESMLRQSIDRGELVVYYQPQVNIESRKMVCVEALVRWNHPERGLLEPKHFIPAAEDIGFVTAVDEFVFRTASSQVVSWLKEGVPLVCITVNLSARGFENPDLVKNIKQILEETGAPSQFLDIEITETLAMRNVERTVTRLKELAEMGIHTSIDDFGTGYSSLNYLKRLPIEKLKIDQSFIKDIVSDPDDRAIIRAVTAMAHQMRMNVIAEGVETEEQLAFLKDIHCDEAQGYLFSRPIPAEQLADLITTP